MREYLKKLPKEILDLLYLAEDIAFQNNMRAYLVGGFVRDLLLGVKNLDLDIAIEGDGIKFAEELSDRLNSKLIRHRRFGTATIASRHNLKIDIATARKEFYPKAAHLPVVSPGTLRDDLFRRDFTINAMSISIMKEDFGSLIDLFEGRADLKHKKIKILHSLSFIDDPTRILRAIRFEKRYNFRLEPQTLKLLKEAVHLKMLQQVQPQRIRDELVLLLKEGRALKQIMRLRQLGGFSFIHPRLILSKNNCLFLKNIQKQVNWFKRSYPQRRYLDAWLVYFLGIVSSLSKPEIKAVSKKFVFSRGEEKRILSLKEVGPKFISSLSRSGLKPSRIYTMLEPLSYELIILLKAKYAGPNIQKHIAYFFEIYNGMRTLTSGHDLCALGVRPGPCYRKIFSKVLQAKLDGMVKTRTDELNLIRDLIKRG